MINSSERFLEKAFRNADTAGVIRLIMLGIEILSKRYERLLSYDQTADPQKAAAHSIELGMIENVLKSCGRLGKQPPKPTNRS